MNSSSPKPQVQCQDCGSPTSETEVAVTFWIGTELKVVEGVPAFVCDRCQARHYGDVAEQRLASLVASGAPEWKAARQIAVPVFAYADIVEFGTAQSASSSANVTAETGNTRAAPAAERLADNSDVSSSTF